MKKIELSKHLPWSEAKADQRRNTIQDVFKPGFWPEPSIGHETMLPVFIVGMMRSGSTLTETMLDSHHQIWGMGEETVFGAESQKLQQIFVQNYNDKYTLEKKIKAHGESIANRMKNLADQFTAETPRAGKITRVVDKNLFNYGNIGFINYVYPNAVIIHTVRDPLDTILSCYKNRMGDHEIEWNNDPYQMVYEYVVYLEIVNHFRQVLPGRIHEVLYEDMVRDPEATIRGVIEKMKLEWDPNVMQFYKSNRTIQTLSVTQVRAYFLIIELYCCVMYVISHA